MKIMKYKANTEKEAMLQAKEELGSNALILEIKMIKPKGIFRFFRKTFVEITAAADDNQKMQDDREVREFKAFLSSLSEKQRQMEAEQQIPAEKEKSELQEIPKLQEVPKLQETSKSDEQQSPQPSQMIKADSQSVVGQVIYEQLLENEVDETVANQLLKALMKEGGEPDLENGLSLVYQQMVEALSDLRPITVEGGKAKSIFFVGSTGVGKTTTIAKLASIYSLQKKYKLALITADTYRIAAVEQLRTYANILNIPIKVIYSEDEILDCLEEFKDMDLILIDTAGRSYQDSKHIKELQDLLKKVEDKQVYLVLSLSTKNSDLMKTIAAYDFAEVALIFTKLDETLAYGSILNLRQKTGKPLSYITTGQNVPEDIEELDPYEIANKILGGVNS